MWCFKWTIKSFESLNLLNLITQFHSDDLSFSHHQSFVDDTSAGSFLRYVKVALAVAVIRSSPPGMTGRQYAEQLFLQSQRRQLFWRTRGERLKEEVLQLKQQLIQTQASVAGAASVCQHRPLQPGLCCNVTYICNLFFLFWIFLLFIYFLLIYFTFFIFICNLFLLHLLLIICYIYFLFTFVTYVVFIYLYILYM